ncbi:DNA-directed RNA polymerase subunit beta [Candidatus Peregrinibacteria bacterium CG1_02_41_10]|nr:MAG: DNA-directed RNA polymerase subunit beta [Candidatus Peregrinibacteria bacterium CG1_02_41_10]
MTAQKQVEKTGKKTTQTSLQTKTKVKPIQQKAKTVQQALGKNKTTVNKSSPVTRRVPLPEESFIAFREREKAPKVETTLPIVKYANKRVYFTKELDQLPMPNLLEVQLKSYHTFLEEGIRERLEEISPVVDFSENKVEMYFLEHSFDKPKHNEREAKRRNLNYEAPLKVKVQLINKETGEIKEQEVYLGGIPLMTSRGTFIINGVERIVVNQIVRSEGVLFSRNAQIPGYYNAKIIPERGAWLEVETDRKGIISVKIDRKRKLPVTLLLRALGYEKDQEIISLFSDVIKDINHDFILSTLEKDTTHNKDEACQAIYWRLRPGDLATAENARHLIENMFLSFKKYDMGTVARYKLNKRFGLNKSFKREHRVFQPDDFVQILKHLILLNQGEGSEDDIDHLSNRRVRSVGELVENKLRVGLLRMERIAKDRMTVMDMESFTPTQLINSRPITASLREFFSSSQLSQFMDQTNPLSELAHKRRVSAMGPGGLSRERAGFEVRDVHTSHYGRICPIETPEGPNIGLIGHLATYAKVNQYGFIETPYLKVHTEVENKADKLVGRIVLDNLREKKTKKIIASKDQIIDQALASKISKLISDPIIKVRAFVSDEFEYYAAEDERTFVIAQANTPLDEHNNILQKRVSVRKGADPILVSVREVTHIDVSPKQILSVSSSLIPFIEHDDTVRALMGSNMQRQAVPLLKPEPPVVGTGIEGVAARNSGYVYVAERDGEVLSADGKQITIMYNNGEKIEYILDNFIRSNHNTLIHQSPRVVHGQKIKKGEVLVDAQAISEGEISLGHNLLVAYMSWKGYNFEDAIIISDRLFREDIYSSVHISDFVTEVRETKLGPEISTRDIPNVSEARLANLDEEGIIRIGASVNESDILVGKITPKGETDLTPEERLLQAIFGEKAKNVKDTSLKLPGGEGGKVVGVDILTREAGDELPTGVIKQIKVYVAQTRKVEIGDKMAGRHGNKGVISTIVPEENMPYLADGTPVDIVLNPLGVVSRMNIGQILETHLGWAARKLGIRVATPALNGCSVEQIKTLLVDAGLPSDGKVQLYDGGTGEPFKEKITVGVTYMLKLHHLVEDKIHARSVGPYSLVTQQPLGGKAQHGGQRFGEMEVWALEAYGAAYTLQEMLTIKSDDVRGRSRTYEAIIKGEDITNPNIPESFNVLVNELKALGLSISLLSEKGERVGDIRNLMEDEEQKEETKETKEELEQEIEETFEVLEEEAASPVEELVLDTEVEDNTETVGSSNKGEPEESSEESSKSE